MGPRYEDSADWSPLKGIGAFILVVLFIFAVAFGLRGLGLVQFQFWAPKEEAARREVFEESKSYRDGMNQELRNMQMQYVQADAEHRLALRSIILHRVAGFPADALQPDLAAFVNSLNRGVSP